MSASYGDNTIAESILDGFPYLIDVEPSDLAPLHHRARLIEDGKRYAHSSGFSSHGIHRPAPMVRDRPNSHDCNTIAEQSDRTLTPAAYQ